MPDAASAGAVWVTALELDDPLQDLVAPRGADLPDYQAARLLVRLHSHPLGELEIPLVDGSASGQDIVLAIQRRLDPALQAHLRADGLPPVVLTPAGAGRVVPGPPTCSWQARLAPLAHPLPLVSVVIATCRRPDRLRRTLRSIADQTYAELEVLVVDNAPWEQGVQEGVAGLGDPRFRALEEWVPGASRARNRGLHEARGDIVLFTDDDVDVDRDWVGNLVTPFYEDAGIGCVTGLILPASLDSEAERMFEQFGGFAKGYEARTFSIDDTEHGPLYPYNAGLFGSGASAAFRGDLLRSIGGFPVDLGPATVARGGEDLDVYLSVLYAGSRLCYEPAAVVWHEHRQTPNQLAGQVYSYGIGLSAMIAKRVLASPAERRAVLRALPAAARYVLAGDSAKNEARTAHYPKRLVACELAGLAYGPFAYLRSRRRAARTRVG